MSYIGATPTSTAFLTDSFSGDGSTTSFTLSAAPASSSSILVAVSGVLQDPATYAVVGTALNFTGAPPSGTANISVRYLGIPASNISTAAYRTVTEFTATAGQTSFSTPSYTVGFINVYRNGVLLGSADYTATTGTTVVLASGATAGDLITTESFYVSSIYNAISNTAGSVNSNNIADGAVTPSELSTGGPYWDTSGNVGIGTSSPSSFNGLLNVKGSDRAVISYFGGTTYAARVGANSSFATVEGVDAATGASSYQPLQVGGSVLSLATGGTERMRIDSSGYVTTPSQPVFQAFKTTNTSSGNHIVFDSTWVNVGSFYNASNGRFTAPVAGTYQFSYGSIGNNSVTTYRLSLHKNGSALTLNGVAEAQARAQTADAGCYPTANKVVMVSLTAGDYIQVYFNSDNGTALYGDNSGYTHFSGFLVG